MYKFHRHFAQELIAFPIGMRAAGCLSESRAPLCPSAPWPSPSPAWLSLSPFLVGSAPLRRWIVTSDQPTVQIAEGHYPKSFPRRQTSTIKRLRTLLLNRGVRWVRRSHV